MSIKRTAVKTIMDFMLWRVSLTDLRDHLASLYLDHEILLTIQAAVDKYHGQLSKEEAGKRTMFPPEPVRLARKEIVDTVNRYLPNDAHVDINDNMSLLHAFYCLDRRLAS